MTFPICVGIINFKMTTENEDISYLYKRQHSIGFVRCVIIVARWWYLNGLYIDLIWSCKEKGPARKKYHIFFKSYNHHCWRIPCNCCTYPCWSCSWIWNRIIGGSSVNVFLNVKWLSCCMLNVPWAPVHSNLSSHQSPLVGTWNMEKNILPDNPREAIKQWHTITYIFLRF